jgi:hypothetical protein
MYQGSADLQERELCGFLPKCHSRDDVVSFFHTFVRRFELNDVDAACCARLLLSYLYMKTVKIYTKLSVEQSKQYVNDEREILTRFKLDAVSYR